MALLGRVVRRAEEEKSQRPGQADLTAVNEQWSATLESEESRCLLARVYLSRSDPSAEVAEEAERVWRQGVAHPPKAIRAVMHELMRDVMAGLQGRVGEEGIERSVSCLSELGRRFVGLDPSRATNLIMPHLFAHLGPRATPRAHLEEAEEREEEQEEREKEQREEEQRRIGALQGLAALVEAGSSREHVQQYLVTLSPYLVTALCDPSEAVREHAGALFRSFRREGVKPEGVVVKGMLGAYVRAREGEGEGGGERENTGEGDGAKERERSDEGGEGQEGEGRKLGLVSTACIGGWEELVCNVRGVDAVRSLLSLLEAQAEEEQEEEGWEGERKEGREREGGKRERRGEVERLCGIELLGHLAEAISPYLPYVAVRILRILLDAEPGRGAQGRWERTLQVATDRVVRSLPEGSIGVVQDILAMLVSELEGGREGGGGREEGEREGEGESEGRRRRAAQAAEALARRGEEEWGRGERRVERVAGAAWRMATMAGDEATMASDKGQEWRRAGTRILEAMREWGGRGVVRACEGVVCELQAAQEEGGGGGVQEGKLLGRLFAKALAVQSSLKREHAREEAQYDDDEDDDDDEDEDDDDDDETEEEEEDDEEEAEEEEEDQEDGNGGGADLSETCGRINEVLKALNPPSRQGAAHVLLGPLIRTAGEADSDSRAHVLGSMQAVLATVGREGCRVLAPQLAQTLVKALAAHGLAERTGGRACLDTLLPLLPETYRWEGLLRALLVVMEDLTGDAAGTEALECLGGAIGEMSERGLQLEQLDGGGVLGERWVQKVQDATKVFEGALDEEEGARAREAAERVRRLVCVE